MNQIEVYSHRFSLAVAAYGRDIERVPEACVSLFRAPETWTPPEQIAVEDLLPKTQRRSGLHRAPPVAYEDPEHPCPRGHTTFKKYPKINGRGEEYLMRICPVCQAASNRRSSERRKVQK